MTAPVFDLLDIGLKDWRQIIAVDDALSNHSQDATAPTISYANTTLGPLE